MPKERQFLVDPREELGVLGVLLKGNVPPVRFRGFDLNIEGAKIIAIVEKPCKCCTTVWALDDVPYAIEELRRFYETFVTGLTIPFTPSRGESRLLGLYRSID